MTSRHRSLVVLEQVVKFVVSGVNRDLPEAAVSKGGVNHLGLGKLHLYDLVFGGGSGSGLVFALWLVERFELILVLVFLVVVILIVVIVVRGRVVLHHRGETLEALHDVVHVDVELVSLVLIIIHLSGAPAQVAVVSLV